MDETNGFMSPSKGQYPLVIQLPNFERLTGGVKVRNLPYIRVINQNSNFSNLHLRDRKNTNHYQLLHDVFYLHVNRSQFRKSGWQKRKWESLKLYIAIHMSNYYHFPFPQVLSSCLSSKALLHKYIHDLDAQTIAILQCKALPMNAENDVIADFIHMRCEQWFCFS